MKIKKRSSSAREKEGEWMSEGGAGEKRGKGKNSKERY